MSELINTNDDRATIRWKLLTGASVFALVAYVSSAGAAKTEDSERPLLWIELGGQMEQIEGLSAPFTAPFMFLTPMPDVYDGISFIGNQRPSRFAFGAEGKITFRPEDSNWTFSAGIRYGRSHSKRHTHRQLDRPTPNYDVSFTFYGYPYHYSGTKYIKSAAVADAKTQNAEHHLILDFQAGKDVGLGMFGRNGSSAINAGVRIASFTSQAGAYITARPNINLNTGLFTFYGGVQLPVIQKSFYQYTMRAQAQRSFKGIGPAISWDASAVLAGNEQDGEFTLDWGVNAGALFGKQRVKVQHTTQAYHSTKYSYSLPYHNEPPTSVRSRFVTVPNIGGFAGLSWRSPHAKISIGYRYDTFLGATDTGIDAAKKSNLTFNGPYASISIGLGD